MATAGARPYVIPGKPETLIEITNLLNAAEIDVDKIVYVLRQDVSLYTAVIATANNPMFRGKREITSLNEAVVRLGLNTLVTIIRLIALKNALSKVDRLERFWDCASEIADLTVYFNRIISNKQEENAFSLGMLHNCGIPLLMETLPDYRDFLQNSEIDDLPTLLALEKTKYGYNHFQISYKIAKRWLLPEPVIQAIALQSKDPRVIGKMTVVSEDSKLLACALILAKDVSQAYRHYWRIENTQQKTNNLKPILEYSGIPETDYVEMREDLISGLVAAS
ncbi:MAG: HD-like signal output (HDOD) protein [Oceanospirillaceae bacterium]|jgi:HD-like signal output (HDOD) protein